MGSLMRICCAAQAAGPRNRGGVAYMQARAAWPVRCVSRTAGRCAGPGPVARAWETCRAAAAHHRCRRFVTNGHVRAHCDRCIGDPRTGTYPDPRRTEDDGIRTATKEEHAPTAPMMAIRFPTHHAFQTFPSKQGPTPRAGPRASQENDHERSREFPDAPGSSRGLG